MKLMVFDVGGTDIKYCIMDESLERMHAGAVPTPQDTQEHFFQTIKEIYDKMTEVEPVEGVAMSLPGFIDSEKGRNNGGGFMEYNQGKSIGPELEEILGTRVVLGNDGKCAALAELRAGALKGCDNAAVYIIGTGVGGGLIVNGKILNGSHFTAGEYSFLVTNFEKWEEMDQSLAIKGSTTGLLKMYKKAAGLEDKEKVNGKDFFGKVLADDAVAIEVLDEFSTNVAKAIFNISVLLDLEKVAIGGGISRQPILLEYIQNNLEKLYHTNKFVEALSKPEIVNCAYSSDANMVGAYMFYKDMK